MGCLECLVKFGLCVVSKIFLVLGIIILLVGLLMLLLLPTIQDFVGDFNVKHQCTYLIVLGIFSIGLGIFGIIGAVTKNFIILVVFLVAIVFLILVQLYVTYTLLYEANEVSDSLDRNLHKKFPSIVKLEDKNLALTWHLFEIKEECCGIQGPDDYNKTVNGTLPPLSCCKDMTEEQWKNIMKSQVKVVVSKTKVDPSMVCGNNVSKLYKNGCYESINSSIVKVYSALKTMTFIHIIINIVGACLAGFLVLNKFNPIPLP